MKRWFTHLTTVRNLPLWLGLAIFIGLLYLAYASLVYGYSGFPLDDGWIHQTYARNLGLRGEFSFTPGVPSTGSTAPFWTILLSLGYRLAIPYKLWTYGLGMVFLGLSGFSMARLGQRLFPERLWLGPLIGIAVILEWHLGWAAVSGMETILFVWLSIFLLERYASFRELLGWRQLLFLGILGGLLALVRPEGLGLIGLIGIDMGLITIKQASQSTGRIQALFQRWLIVGLGILGPVLPYLIFNYATTGLILPNTFYAKQQEYAILSIQFTFIERWFRIFGITFVGMQILLGPGIINGLIKIWRQKNPLLLLILIWWLSYVTLYAVRLPVIYQHGRYQIPMIPWILLIGIWGTVSMLRLNHRQLWPRVLSRVWVPSLIVATVLFVFLGLRSYANDVRIIETEMVAVAHWLQAETEPDTIIAAHDIGAIGYFTERPLVDLAGLITPEVIPFIRDEEALLDFATHSDADYLVTFPSWYPNMTQLLNQVYNTNSPWAIEAGSDNIAIYTLR